MAEPACLEYQDVYGPLATDTSPSWSGAARSIIEFAGDCWFGFEVSRASVGVVVGLNTENLGAHYLEISHALSFGRGTVRTMESGAVAPGVGPIIYTEGDRFYIIRLGATVAYLIRPVGTPADDYFIDLRLPGVRLPGGVLYVSGQPSYGTVFLDISMYAVGDQIQNEAAGEVWTTSETAEDGAALALPFTVAFASGVDTWATLDILFTVTSGGSTSPGATLELPFTVLGADIPLESLIIAELPFTVSAEGSEAGGSIYPTLSGISGFFLYEVDGRITERNAGVEAWIPFALAAFGSSAGMPLNSGARLSLPINLFMTGSGGAELPITGGAMLNIPFDVLATGSNPTDVVITAGAWLDLPFILAATGHADDDVAPMAGAYGELTFSVQGTGSELVTDYFYILLSFNAIPSLPLDPVDIMENITVSMQMVARYVMLMREFLAIAATPRTFTLQAVELLETATAVAEAIPQFSLFIQETFDITGTLTVVQVIEMADALVVAGMVQTQYQGIVAILSAILISDGVVDAYAKEVNDAVTASDSLQDIVQLLALLTENFSVADTLQNVLTIIVLETAEVEAGDTIELSAQYFASMLDRVEVLAFIKTPAELAQGWVVNTEGAMPISEYDNYIFNSMAYGSDEMLGCNDQGLYVLDGDDDAGTDIDAEIASLMMDFDTSKLKRMSTVYIGYKSDGKVLLRVRSVDQGQFVEDWYEGRNTAAQTPSGQNRMKIGKGLRSRYWTFELANIDGSDFELDKVELYPIVLDRRI